MAVKPDYPEALGNLGRALRQMGHLDEAVYVYRHAFTRADSVTYNNLGVALKRQGEIDEAMAAFRQAAGIEPGYAMAHFNLGSAHTRKGTER